MEEIMGNSWWSDGLNNLASKVKEALGDYVESRSWNISEEMVNKALELYISIKGIKELKTLFVRVLDGQFEVNAVGEKFIPFSSKTMFTIESCDISSDSQKLVICQIGKTSVEVQSIYAKVLVAILQSILAIVLGFDPAKYLAGKQPGISIDGDRYIIDLSETDLHQYINHKMVNGLVTNVKITDILCIPGKFLVKAHLRAAEEVKK
jgi:hypothetical protein